MEYRQLGSSGLRVSALSLGTMSLGDQGEGAPVGMTDVDRRGPPDRPLPRRRPEPDRHRRRLLGRRSARRSSARSCGAGATGSCWRRRRASRWARGPNDAGLSRHHIIEACEASLRRLQTEHIDLYQLHQWDGQTRLEETLDALDALVRSGKVRYVGCSNYSAWHLMKALGIAEHRGSERFVSQQIHYTLQAREAEYELVPAALDQGLGILVWSPLAGGLLSGKYRRGREAPAGSRHLTDWDEPPVHDEDKLYDIVDALVEIGETHGVSAAQVALAWLLGRPGVTLGGRRRAHRGAARRQPRRGRPAPDRGPARAPGRGQRAAAALPATGTRRRRPRTGCRPPT